MVASKRLVEGAAAMDSFIARENIKHFLDRLWSERDAATRSRIRQLLIAEEDKLAASLGLLADIERHIADGTQRIERQRALVTAMRRDGRDGLPTAEALLDGMIESQLLIVKYREQTQTVVEQNRL
jgi:hypothetical protein